MTVLTLVNLAALIRQFWETLPKEALTFCLRFALDAGGKSSYQVR